MGTWGVNTFENDSALDWITELEEEKDLTKVAITFAELFRDNGDNNGEFVNSDLSSEALAAAEIVAALLGKPGKKLPLKIAKWIEKKRTYDRGLVSLLGKVIESPEYEDKPEIAWKKCTKEQKWDIVLNLLSEYAIGSINLVLEKSELVDLWKESGNYEKWTEAVKDLIYRCERKKN